MKREHMTTHYCALLVMLMFIAGCGPAKRISDWSKKTFNQGKELDVPVKSARDYVKTARIYDQFSTAGIFDVMWLSDVVRTSYTQLYATKHGSDRQSVKALERGQLALHDSAISFYLLGYQPSEPKTKLLSIDDQEARWSLFLEIDGKKYSPSTIELVASLDPEYRLFFGKRYNRYQKRYLVTFDAQDADGNPLITRRTCKISLHLSTTERSQALIWDLQDLQRRERNRINEKRSA